jgi:hypothetical protein
VSSNKEWLPPTDPAELELCSLTSDVGNRSSYLNTVSKNLKATEKSKIIFMFHDEKYNQSHLSQDLCL